MASILLHSDRLEIKLTAAEKVLSLRKENVIVPRENIRSVSITDDPWIWVRGIRAPGTAVPLTLAMGQWKFHGGKDFLMLKGTRPAVVIDVVDEEFSRVIITTRQGVELLAALQLEERTPKQPRVRRTEPRTGAVARVKPPVVKKAAKPVAPAKPADAASEAAGTTAPAAKKPAAKAPAKKPAAKPAPKKATPKKPAEKPAAKKPAAKKPAAKDTAAEASAKPRTPRKPAAKPEASDEG